MRKMWETLTLSPSPVEQESLKTLFQLWSKVEGVFLSSAHCSQWHSILRALDEQRWDTFYVQYFDNKSSLKEGYKNAKYPFQASVIDQTTFTYRPLAFWHIHLLCVSLLNDIYYLQTVSILKFPPWCHLTESMDSDSAINDILLQTEGIIVCKPNSGFHVVYLSVLWFCVLSL